MIYMKNVYAWFTRMVSNVLGTSTHTYPRDFDQRAVEIIKRTSAYTMTSPARVYALIEAVRYVHRHQIEGALVECGVWKGGSVMAAALTLLQVGDTSRELYLYDTFKGMTQPSEKDVGLDGTDPHALYRERSTNDGVSQWCSASVSQVRDALATTGYPMERVHFIPGRVEETLPQQRPERIALLRLDTDWYQSTAHELRHLYPNLITGGVLIVDDYGCWQGAQAAVREYFDQCAYAPLLCRIDHSGRMGVKID